MRSFRCPHCKLEHTAWAELPSLMETQKFRCWFCGGVMEVSVVASEPASSAGERAQDS